MTMKQTMKTLMDLKNNGVDIFLTDAGWSLLVRITAELEKNEEISGEDTDQAV
jgi:hypothetical protein